MSKALHIHNRNQILAALPITEYDRLAPQLKVEALSLNQILFRPDEQIKDVYFPVNCIVSLLTELQDGNGLEVGLVGCEGIVGISAFLGGSETKVATVQATGEALRLPIEILRVEFQRGEALQGALLRYTHALMSQISQSVVCNSRHQVAGRLARWLLMYHDRMERDEFELTHEFMANMLGVRRSGVSEVAKTLQNMGFISYQRGRVKILNRKGLEEYTCECYSVIKKKFDKLLPPQNSDK